MRCVRFSGLRAYLERLLDDIALGAAGQRPHGQTMGALIARTADRLNYAVERDRLTPECLSTESRELLGWFRYFSSDEHLATYLLAVQTALEAFSAVTVPRWRPPLLVHFRPSANLYRWRVVPEGTRIILPTPMVVLKSEDFTALARQMAGIGKSSRPSQRMFTPEYRAVAAALAAAGGVADRPVGCTHDLVASFERVNREYFGGTCERPRLTWGSRLTLRKFGHYDFVQDLVMLSRTLDDAEVPTFVVDHVMHHELLHKKHGVRWHRGRRHAHLPAFRKEERTFRLYREADLFLETLSRRLRRCANA